MSDRAFLSVVGLLVVCAFVAGGVGAFRALPDGAVDSIAGDVAQGLALLFGSVGALAGLAQIARMYRTGSADDVSIGFLAMLAASFVAWLAYGITRHDWVLLTVNAAGGSVCVTTLAYATRLRSV